MDSLERGLGLLVMVIIVLVIIAVGSRRELRDKQLNNEKGGP